MHGMLRFVIACDGEPRLLLETKLNDSSPSNALKIFQDQLQIPAIQLTNNGEAFRLISNNDQKILVTPAVMWLGRL